MLLFLFLIPGKQHIRLTVRAINMPSIGNGIILAINNEAVPAMMETSIHDDLKRLGKNIAILKGTKTAVARNPMDKNPRSLIKVPENEVATTTDIAKIPTIVNRVSFKFFLDSFKFGFMRTKTSRTNIVEEPNVSPEPPIMTVTSKVPSTIPPKNSGIQRVINNGKTCADVIMTFMPSGISFPAAVNASTSAEVI